MEKIIKIPIFFLLLFAFIWAEEEEIYRLDRIASLLEKQFWKIKQDNMKKREAYDDELSVLDEKIKIGYLKKNNLTEELYLLKENLAKMKEQWDAVIGEQTEFKNSVAENIDKEGKKLEFSYPYLLTKKLPEINNLRKDLNAYPLENTIANFIEYRRSVISESETIVLGSDIYINDVSSERFTAPYIRVGFVHQSYSSPEQSALILRETSIRGVRFVWENKISEELKSKLSKNLSGVINAKSKKNNDELVNIHIDVAQSGRKLESFVKNDLSGFGSGLVDFFKDGGIIMYPLAFLLIFGLFVFFERILFYSQNSIKKLSFVDKALEFIRKNKREKAIAIFVDNPGVMQRILSSIIKNSEKFSRDDAERIIDEKIFKETPAFDKRLPTLAVIAAVAPLLGLLGTVSGMIQLFDVITTYGTADPKILAGGISVALVTTQAGLGLAIPFMLAHHVLTRKKTNIVNHLEQIGIETLEVLYPPEINSNSVKKSKPQKQKIKKQ